MSLPLTRRIAKTVLLTAAGAVSVVGTAGAASAAELPSTADVGGLSNLDTPDLGNSVDGARSAHGLTPKSSKGTLDKAADNATGTTAPEALGVAGQASDQTHKTVRDQAPQATAAVPNAQAPGQTPAKGTSPAEALPTESGTPVEGLANGLPGNTLNVKNLGLGV